jgi:hypothetical protein
MTSICLLLTVHPVMKTIYDNKKEQDLYLFSINKNFIDGLWYLMPHSTIFQLYCGTQFYWWR